MLLYLITSLLFIFYYFTGHINSSREIMLAVIIFNFVCLIPFYIIIRRYKDNSLWMSGVTIFLISYFIVFFQYDFHYAINIDVINNSYFFIYGSGKNIGNGLILSTIGLHIFLLGYCIVISSRKYAINISEKFKRQIVMFGRNNYTMPLYFIALISYLLFLATAGDYMYGAYGARLNNSQSISLYFRLIYDISFKTLLIQRLLYVAYSAPVAKMSLVSYVKRIGFPITLLASLMALIPLLAGDRGPFISISLMYGSLYLCRYSKFSFLKCMVIFLLASSLMTFIGIIRSTDYRLPYTERFELYRSQATTRVGSFLTDDYDNVYGASTLELAGSVRTLHHVMDNVPDKYPHTWGWMQLQQCISFVPFLISSIYKMLDMDLSYDGSATYLSQLIQGDKVLAYGDGTSIIADFYLDFNIFGVVTGMFLFGMFIAKIDKELASGLPHNIFIFMAAVLCYSVIYYFPRGSALYPLKGLILVFVFNFLYCSIMSMHVKGKANNSGKIMVTSSADKII